MVPLTVLRNHLPGWWLSEVTHDDGDRQCPYRGIQLWTSPDTLRNRPNLILQMLSDGRLLDVGNNFETLIFTSVGQHFMDQGEVSVRVIEQVAAYHNVDPLELEPRLHTVIDPNALDRLIRHTDCSSAGSLNTIQFTYKGCTVTVGVEGTVDVTSPAANGDSTSAVAEE